MCDKVWSGLRSLAVFLFLLALTPSVGFAQDANAGQQQTQEKASQQKQQSSDENQTETSTGDNSSNDTLIKPDAAKPDAAKPDAAKPDSAKLGANKPDKDKGKATAAFMAAKAAQQKGDLNEALKLYKEAAALDPKAPDPLRAQAMLYRRMGKMQQAVALAREAIKLDPEDYKTRLELAALLLTRQQPQEAGKLIDEATASSALDHNSADFVQLHSMRSRFYLLQRNLPESANSYRVILKALLKPEDFKIDFRQHQALASDSATSFLTVGRVMLRAGDNKRAVQAFEGELRFRKDQAGEHSFWLALAQYRLDQLAEAQDNLNQYFETGNRTPQSLRLLADLNRADGKSDQTRPRLEELAKDDRDSGVVLQFLGNLLIEQGELDEAAELFQKVLADTGEPGARLGLIRVHVAKRDADAVVDSIRKALRSRIQLAELAPLNAELLAAPDFSRQVVEACVKVAEDDRSTMLPSGFFLVADLARDLAADDANEGTAEDVDLESLEQSLLQATLDGNPPQTLAIETMDRLGFNLLLQDKPKQSASIYRKLLLTPGVPQERTAMALYRLSQAESFSKNHDKAIEAVQAALKIENESPLLNYQLGWVMMQAGRFEEAQSTLAEAELIANGHPDLLFQTRLLRADVLLRIQNFEESIKAYQAILDDETTSAENAKQCRMRLSNAYVLSGDMANGEKYLEEVYESYPDDVGVNNDLGYLYADQGKHLEKAEKMIRFALESKPDESAYLDSLGWVLFKQDKFKEAIEVLKKADSDPDNRDATIVEHLGDALKETGADKEAEKAWADALKIESETDPGDPEIIERLKKKLAN